MTLSLENPIGCAGGVAVSVLFVSERSIIVADRKRRGADSPHGRALDNYPV